MSIHELAVVDPQAEVDPEAVIGPFCVVGAGVRLAAGVELRNHVTVYGRTTIGSETICFPGSVIGSDPQDLKYRGEDSEVVIGQRCRIHECVTVSKGTVGGGMQTLIGDQCLIMAYAHIAHDCRLDGDNVIGNNSQLAGHVLVGRRAVVCGMVGVHHFVTIGENAFVAAMGGVRRDVPPFVIAEGYPAEPRNVNLVGLRRAGWPEEDVTAVRQAFKLFYKRRDGKTTATLLEEIKDEPIGSNHAVQRFCEWIRQHLEQNVKGRVQESCR